MTDPTAGADEATPVARCPWCSAELPDPGARTCPSCKANLVGDGDASIPGLTAPDLERLAYRSSTTPKQSRLLSWISGDSDFEDATEALPPPGSLDLPAADVKREMLRLEMAAMIADLTAEVGAMAADEAMAKGIDPAEARAAIQAEIDAAARAHEIEVEDGLADDSTAAVADPDGAASDAPAPDAAAATAGEADPAPSETEPAAS